MAGLKKIQIVGGGLAGLTLGIALRQKNIAVTIFEAGHYPRHRVCGEFISGRGQVILLRLELDKIFLNSSALFASTTAFFRPPKVLHRENYLPARFAFHGLFWMLHWRINSANLAAN